MIPLKYFFAESNKINYYYNCFANFKSSDAASFISSRAKIADMTDIPSIPVPASLRTLSADIPPIATTGIFTVLHISFKVSIETDLASCFVDVVKTDPTPI